jgi:hypothetical protein
MEGDGHLVTDPTGVLAAVERYYTRKMLPATWVKHGRYLPTEQPRTYPWLQEGSTDPFQLATPAVGDRDEGRGKTLHQRIIL